MKKPKKSVTVKREYTPTAAEISAASKLAAREAAAPRVRMTKGENGSTTYVLHHPDPAFGTALLAEAVGTADQDFLKGLIAQLASTMGPEGGERTLNFLLSIVKGVKPRDEIEAMLAADMAVIRSAFIAFARRLSSCRNRSGAGQC